MRYRIHKVSILIILILLMLFYMLIAHSLSNPNIVWHQTYGEGGSEDAYSIIQTENNGFALIGCTTAGAGSDDIWLLKIDENGTVKWDKMFGGYYEEEGYTVIQTTDGGYALMGYTRTYGSGGTDMWLIKTDNEGTLEWEKTYGGSKSEKGYTVVQTLDGGFLLSGYSNTYGTYPNQVWLVKTAEDGEIEWDQILGLPYDATYIHRKGPLLQTTDQGFVITGYTQIVHEAGFSDDVLFIKGRMNGTVEFRKTYGTLKDDYPTSMIQTNDGGFVISGYIEYDIYNHEAFLLKIDNNGTEQWFETYGRSLIDNIYSVIQTNDGGFALAGITSTTPDDYKKDMWLLRTDEKGKALWNQSFGGRKSDGAYSLIQTADDCFVLAGYTASYGVWDIWLVKTADAPPKSVNAPSWTIGFETLFFILLMGIILRKREKLSLKKN